MTRPVPNPLSRKAGEGWGRGYQAMTRIAARFATLRQQGRGALIPFVEAWDPDAATSMELLRGMPAAGADLIEIGMPFTDPMADGPIIQAAGKRGLRAGVKVAHVLTMVRDFRRDDPATPIILMGYLNPDPLLRHRALLCGRRRRGRGRADHRRSPHRGGRSPGAARRARTGSTSFA